MTEIDPERTARIAATDAKDQRAHRVFGVLVAVTGAGVIALGWGLWSVAGQQSTAAAAAQALAAQVRALGATPVVAAPAPIAGPAGAPGAAGPAGPGPTQQQIDYAVTRYFADHPPGDTPAIVATQVAAYLTANPPPPGRPPTPAEIAAATSDYLSAHAAQFQGVPGPAGQQGNPGQNATDAQVQDAVAAYCSTHNGCAGSPGTNGKDGQPPVSWVATAPDGSTETCTRSNNFDPANPTYDCTETVPSSPPTSSQHGLFRH